MALMQQIKDTDQFENLFSYKKDTMKTLEDYFVQSYV